MTMYYINGKVTSDMKEAVKLLSESHSTCNGCELECTRANCPVPSNQMAMEREVKRRGINK